MGVLYMPNILQCMHFKCESKSNYVERTVMDYEFDFCVGCDREMWINETYYKIEKGCFVIRKPGERVRSGGTYNCYMLTLDFSNRVPFVGYTRNNATVMQKSFESDIWSVLPSVFKPAHSDDYIRIFEQLLSINKIDINENTDSRLLINELLCLLMSDAFCSLYSVGNSQNAPADIVCTYIKEHYMEKICLDDLAQMVHLNKNYLVRQFKKSFGVSPIAYLINVRMKHAKKLLLETDMPIQTIAFYSGYTDPAFFNFYFKKLYSVTPAIYRLSKRNATSLQILDT